ncbi:isopentenyl phosphate kinase-like [Lolium rigidum]|uniref:isopentenyl phosphate kinase-like n=1 Tax=Lolium rigidum TaxID=89674 RepID=UPI001F5DABF6|nr:isopentenyl phosphate kinase-like [Lolium rigidum]
MAEAAPEQRSPATPRPVRCIVKLGGAAITNKGELESIDEGSLRSACAQLRQAMSGDATPEKAMGMDWSRRPGDPADPAVDTDGFRDMAGLGIDTNFIVVHGAGSFGHFQASRSGVHKGGLHTPLVKAGFVATRISVTSLNQEVVRALAKGTLHGNEDYCTLC